MSPCRACNELMRQSVQREPHSDLLYLDTADTSLGRLESYVCKTCDTHWRRITSEDAVPHHWACFTEPDESGP